MRRERGGMGEKERACEAGGERTRNPTSRRGNKLYSDKPLARADRRKLNANSPDCRHAEHVAMHGAPGGPEHGPARAAAPGGPASQPSAENGRKLRI